MSNLSNIIQAGGTAAMTARKFGMPPQVMGIAALAASGYEIYKSYRDDRQQEKSLDLASRIKTNAASSAMENPLRQSMKMH